jgi:hypothetical protein
VVEPVAVAVAEPLVMALLAGLLLLVEVVLAEEEVDVTDNVETWRLE